MNGLESTAGILHFKALTEETPKTSSFESQWAWIHKTYNYGIVPSGIAWTHVASTGSRLKCIQSLCERGLFAYLESYSPRAGLECNIYLGQVQYSPETCRHHLRTLPLPWLRSLVSPRKDLGYKFSALVFAAAFQGTPFNCRAYFHGSLGLFQGVFLTCHRGSTQAADRNA